MRRQDLIIGQRYILSDPTAVGVYEGVHDGTLKLTDGSELLGEKGFLRFTVNVDGTPRTRLVRSGAAVVETEETRQAYERQVQERLQRQVRSYAEASAFLAECGITEVGGPPDGFRPRIRLYAGSDQDPDKVMINGLTIGELRQIATGSLRPQPQPEAVAEASHDGGRAPAQASAA